MPRPRPPHLIRERTRHGLMVWYVRIGKGPRIRLRSSFGTPEFQAEYQAAIAGETRPKRSRNAGKGSLRWLVERYQDSAEWSALAAATQKQRRDVLARVLATAGNAPIDDIDRAAILDGIDRRKNAPSSARHFLKAIRYLFTWAIYAQLADHDPTQGVKAPKLKKSDGWHTWTDDECAAYEARWHVGTRERLAFDLLLYTGLRRADAVEFGRQHIGKDGLARIRQHKTGDVVAFPILPPLQASIDATPSKGLTFIATLAGNPMTPESFGTWFKDACKAAGVPGSAHGLRKAGATRAAQWLTAHQLMALYGWRKLAMAERYTAAADREAMALSGAKKLKIGLARRK